MRFDRILETKSLPSYRMLIRRAIEAGHRVDVIYAAMQSCTQNQSGLDSPKFIFSLRFESGPIPMYEEVFKRSRGDFPPIGELAATSLGWRSYRINSHSVQCAEQNADSILLMRHIDVIQERRTILVSRLIGMVVDVVRFAVDANKKLLSAFFYAENLDGLRSIYLPNIFRDPVPLADDNIILFLENYFDECMPAFIIQIARGFGCIVTRTDIAELFQDA